MSDESTGREYKIHNTVLREGLFFFDTEGNNISVPFGQSRTATINGKIEISLRFMEIPLQSPSEVAEAEVRPNPPGHSLSDQPRTDILVGVPQLSEEESEAHHQQRLREAAQLLASERKRNHQNHDVYLAQSAAQRRLAEKARIEQELKVERERVARALALEAARRGEKERRAERAAQQNPPFMSPEPASGSALVAPTGEAAVVPVEPTQTPAQEGSTEPAQPVNNETRQKSGRSKPKSDKHSIGPSRKAKRKRS